MSWKDLDIKLKAELIKLGVQSGIRDIKLIRLLYDDNNTPTLVVDLFYNETNVRPLLGIERIIHDYGIPEEEINKTNEILQLIEKEISLEEINNQLPVLFRLFKNGGYKDKPPFEKWYKTIPSDRNDTTYYNLRKAYEELPFEKLEKWRTATPQQLKYEEYHLPTVSPRSLEFLKSRNHPSIKYEIEWYNSPEGKEFRDNYNLDTTGDYYRYTPKRRGGYISNNPTLAYVGKVKKYEEGGLKDSNILLNYIFNGPLKRKKENSLEYRQALFNNVDPRNGYPSPWTAVKYYNTVVDALNSGNTSKKWETDGSIGQETAAAGWAKYLDLPYNKELFPVWNGDTVSLSPELEREIPIDTNLLKLDILEILYDRELDRSRGIFDREDVYKALLYTKQLALDNLRKTYKTGEWVQMNEFMGNSVNPFVWGKDYVSPLNVLLFYGLRYDKNTNSMLYGDLYNLNAFDYFLPGKPFIIRGSIPLDKKKNGGKVKKYSKGGYKNPEEPPISESTYVELPPLNILELELLNYLLSNPTAEQEYFRNLAVLNMTAPQSNLGVVLTKEEQDLVDKAILGYNNFRYSHPWAEGLNYIPIIGDGMDLISLAGDVNNKNYISAGLGLGMLALPNFILKPLLKGKVLKLLPISYGKRNMLKKIKNKTWDKHFNKALLENNIQEARKIFNLHLEAKTPKGYLSVVSYHGSRLGNAPLRIYTKSPTKKTYGFYMTPDKNYATGYLHILGGASVIRQVEPSEFTLTYKNMYTFPDYNSGYAINSQLYKNLINLGYDSGITFYNNRIPEYIAFNPNLVKSNNLITYNKSKKPIPLSARHNFKRPDSNYSWLIPTIPFGLVSYKLFNQNNQEEYKNGGFLFPNLVFSHKFEK